MKDIKVLNTLEDMVNVALYDTKRYSLGYDAHQEYDDPVAGKAWEDKDDEMTAPFASYGTPEWKAYDKRRDAYNDLKPDTHTVTTGYLKHDYSREFQLSTELAEQLDAVWTKKVTRYSSTPERTGLLTLAGMLKRLGRTDVADKIRKAETDRKNKEAMYRRNNLRKGILDKLADLEKYVTNYGAEIGVTVEMFNLPTELEDKLQAEVIE